MTSLAATDDLGDAVVEPAIDLVRRWLGQASAASSAPEARAERRLRRLTADGDSLAFTMRLCDQVARPESARAAASQLRSLVADGLPNFLTPFERGLLGAGAALSRAAPRAVMWTARRRIRHEVGDLVVASDDRTLTRRLAQLRAAGFAVNANLLGEVVLGDEEAARRQAAIVDLLDRPDVDYVSVKASAVASRLDLWGYDHSLERAKDGLRPILRHAAAKHPPKFVNLDMEEYRDLDLTLDAFTELLDEPELLGCRAGIVLQAYLPDAFGALCQLAEWAAARRAGGGAPIKVRIVKGANLAMERVEAALHGWAQAPYLTKAETDANYKRMADWAMVPERIEAVRVGIASHNLFDVAWAKLLSERRGVEGAVEFEMLQGMAPAIARTVRDDVGGLRLYTPIVAPADFDSALAYLFRRLEENSSGDNFLRHLFDLAGDPAAFDAEQSRFEHAVRSRWVVSPLPRRRQPPAAPARRSLRQRARYRPRRRRRPPPRARRPRLATGVRAARGGRPRRHRPRPRGAGDRRRRLAGEARLPPSAAAAAGRRGARRSTSRADRADGTRSRQAGRRGRRRGVRGDRLRPLLRSPGPGVR